MKETDIQAGIISYLQMLENMGKLYFFRSGAGAIGTKTGGMFKTVSEKL